MVISQDSAKDLMWSMESGRSFLALKKKQNKIIMGSRIACLRMEYVRVMFYEEFSFYNFYINSLTF